MAKKKKTDYTEEQIHIIDRIIYALTVVYGPIDIIDLTDKIRQYFPKQCDCFTNTDLLGIIDLMSEEDVLFINDEDLVSLFSNEELKELLSIKEIRNIFYSDVEKTFDDPNEILQYSDMFDLPDNEKQNRLREYIYSLNFKKEKDRKDAYAEAIVVIYKMFDPEEYMDQLQMRVKGNIDREKLDDLMTDFGSEIPRGFLKGYSMVEMGKIMKEFGPGVLLNANRLEPIRDYKKYGAYSYRECMVKARKLKETGIFEDFCSDNIMELYINGKEIFVQLLGYYNGDRNIIVYGDREKFEYNYHFVMDEGHTYPDIVARINYSEVVLDDAGGFLTDQLKEELDERKTDTLPLIFDFDPVQGPSYPSKSSLSLIGAVLDQLLEIYDIMGEEIGERCQEGDSYKIIQFYLGEDGLSLGEYTYPELGEVKVPFAVDEVDEPLQIKAKRNTDLSIAIYAFPIQSEKRPSYVTILFDKQIGMILNMFVDMEEDMHNIKERIISFLEERGLRLHSLRFNSEFTEEVLGQLYDIYNIEYDEEIGDENLDEIFQYLQEVLKDPDFEGGDLPIDKLIH